MSYTYVCIHMFIYMCLFLKDEANLAAIQFVQNKSRDLRTKSRQQMRTLNSDDNSKLLAVSKEKSLQIEESKKQKLIEKEKQMKLLLKEEEREMKESMKKAKETIKKEDRIKSSYRKDVSNEIKKIRSECGNSVLQYFDNEQEKEFVKQSEIMALTSASDMKHHHNLSSSDMASLLKDDTCDVSELDSFFQSNVEMLKLSNIFGINSEDAEKIVNIVNCVYSMRRLLHLSHIEISIENFIKNILNVKKRNKDDQKLEQQQQQQTEAEEVIIKAEEMKVVLTCVPVREYEMDMKQDMEIGDTATAPNDTSNSLISAEIDQDLNSGKSAEAMRISSPGDDLDGEMEADLNDASNNVAVDENVEEQPLKGRRGRKPLKSIALREENTEEIFNDSMLDVLQLNIIQVLLPDLYETLSDNNDRSDHFMVEAVSSKDKKGRGNTNEEVGTAKSIPLNQLTWVEIARMVIITEMGKELGKTDDEVSVMYNYMV